MTDGTLASAVFEADDAFEANEMYQSKGWTDGLPIVPPTDELVARFVAASGMQARELLGTEPVRRRRISVEKAAIAAVMAGCLPAYMPVVAATVRAMCDPAFGLHGCTASTGGSAPMIIVNGPVRTQLAMNATHNVLGNGNRANASIGRATRLLIHNVLGGAPGQLDRSTFGHAGKYSMCFAEDEEDSLWVPLAQERGIAAGESAVTVVAVESPHQIMNEWTTDPRELLDTYARAVQANMLTYSIWSGNYVILVAKQHRDVFNAAGWSKADIREYMFEQCVVRRSQWQAVGKGRVAAAASDDERLYRAMSEPDDLLVVAAGGPAGGFGVVAPPWFGLNSRAITETVRVPAV